MSSLSVPPPIPFRAPTVGPLRSGWVFVRRSARHSLRNVETLLMGLMLPVVLMLLFTFVFGGAFDIGPAGPVGSVGSVGPVGSGAGHRELYATYVTPGIVLLCAGFGAAGTAVEVAQDLSTGWVDRLRTLPVRSAGVVTGAVVASLVRNLLATGVVVGVGLLVGFRPTAGVLHWLAAVGLIALFVLAITWLYAAIGLVAGSPQAASAYGFVLLFLPYLSSAFVPTSTMPAVLSWIADHQPVTPVIDTLRALLTGAPARAGSGWVAVLWCVGISVAAALWAGWLFRHRAGRR
ncbi:ABC transporter permease [Nakamurella endophytica]|uniref:Transport permease protein n=1 Tax=Nakamurella endophytica TaxID=1748367 RepID=A0A917TA60_9ACTN|nr:ABC transporter permease [Nakamurella endophytica]GGM14836.1 transport permease protein [Nakamurella endophytica]